MRTGTTLNFLLSDQLGSTSITTDANGVKVSELRYKPWGEVRFANGTTPTKYTYTGQYSNMSDFGLMFYNARWYDPALGRFAQADSVVPGGVQGYDRYAYVGNNPIGFADSTGHCRDEDSNYKCKHIQPNQQSKRAAEAARMAQLAALQALGGGGKPYYAPPPPFGTPTPCGSLIALACQPTATSTPTATPTLWEPLGQRTGEEIANGVVDAGSTLVPAVVDTCFKPSLAPGCGATLDDAFQLLPQYHAFPIPPGRVFDFSVGTIQAVGEVTPTPQGIKGALIIGGVGIPTILIPVVITLFF